MRKALLLLLPILIINTDLFSQVDITLGKPYTVIDATHKYYFHYQGEILTVKVDKREVILQKLDGDRLSFINIKKYEDFPDGFTLENVTQFKDRFYVFYSVRDRKDGFEQLFFREIDFGSGAFLGKGTRVIKVNGKISDSGSVSYAYYWRIGRRSSDKFDFYYSYDSSKMVIQYRLKPEIKRDDKSYDIIGMHVFEKDMQSVWEEKVKMPYTEKKMNNLDYSVDREGNAYILTMIYDDNTTDLKKTKEGPANYHVELLKVKANTGEISITPVKLKDKFINKVWIYETGNNYMLCAGFYNKGKDFADADGVMLFKIDKDGNLFDVGIYEIPVQLLNEYSSRKTVRKNIKKDEDDKAEFEDLTMREVFIEKDGSILLIGEQYYMKQYTTYSQAGGYRTYYRYFYNDILVTKIDPDGKLSWMKKLPKRQSGSEPGGGMSYHYMKGEKNHYIMFLDNEKNKNLRISDIPAGHIDGAGGFFTACKISNSNGNVERIQIFDMRDVKGVEVYQFKTSRILPLSREEFVIETYKKKKEDILIKVSLSE